MVDESRIRKVTGLWVVRSEDAILAESRDVLELDEPGREAVVLFPTADIAMALLDRTGDRFALVAASGTIPDVAYTVSDRLAFDPRKVTIERL
ncbi:hypothetical protein QCN27_12345 [Cereibacter sp. SYSU M97828]|nr:hypothetical protein [Cereibacter flavus]